MSALRLIFASLAYHWRVQLAVAGGVVAGTAVITGALLVGDSMQGSLRDLTLQRLGRIDEALVADRFFRAIWPPSWPNSPPSAADFADAVPAILLRTTLETPERDPPRSRQSGQPDRLRRAILGASSPTWRPEKGISPISAGEMGLFPPVTGRWCSTSRWPGSWASARATR